MFSINAASAFTIDIDTYAIADGAGYFDNPDTYFEEDSNIYSIVTKTDGVYKIGITSDRVTDSLYNVVIGYDSNVDIWSSVVSNDGYLYYATNTGVFMRNTRDSTTPYYTNDTRCVTVSPTYTNVKCMRAYGDYIYFVNDMNNVLYKINTDTLTISTAETYTGVYIRSFDIYNDELYYIGTTEEYTQPYILYKEDAQLTTIDNNFYYTDRGYSGIQVTNNYIYTGGSNSNNDYFNDIYYHNGTFFDNWAFSYTAVPGSYNVETINRNQAFWIGYETNTSMTLYQYDKFEVVTTLDRGINPNPEDITNGSSSDNSSSSSSFVGDSHEYTNDEVESILRQYVPPIFIIVLLLFLIYAFGGN